MKESVVFFCEGNRATRAAATGLTENVSNTGIAFLTDVDVELGSHIRLDLQLRSTTDGEKKVLLHAEGTVVRVEAAGIRNRIAAEIRFQDDLEEGFAVSKTIQ